jgi:heterodisulfide reductase subunit A2
MTEKVGVYVCHCGSNIAGTVDVEDVAQLGGGKTRSSGRGHCARLQVHVLEFGAGVDREGHQGTGLTRVVVAACSPHLHEKTFPHRGEECGLESVFGGVGFDPRAGFVGAYG